MSGHSSPTANSASSNAAPSNNSSASARPAANLSVGVARPPHSAHPTQSSSGAHSSRATLTPQAASVAPREPSQSQAAQSASAANLAASLAAAGAGSSNDPALWAAMLSLLGGGTGAQQTPQAAATQQAGQWAQFQQMATQALMNQMAIGTSAPVSDNCID